MGTANVGNIARHDLQVEQVSGAFGCGGGVDTPLSDGLRSSSVGGCGDEVDLGQVVCNPVGHLLTGHRVCGEGADSR